MSILTLALGVCALTVLVILALSVRAWLRKRSWLKLIWILSAVLAAVPLLLGASYSWWYHHRAQPAPLTEELFPGVEHQRIVRTSPRPLVINVLRVALDNPGISLLVTPLTPTGDRDQKARTTTEFVEEFNVQLAINANFFTPWSGSYFRPVPAVGGEVDVLGWAVTGGLRYGLARRAYTSFVFTKDKQARLGQPDNDTIHAVSGQPVLIRDGALTRLTRHELEPRTALGVTRNQELVMVTVDGRQPGYSEGISLAELAELMVELHCHDALNLDGGGSTTMVARPHGEDAQILNSPIHRRIPPGQERPIGNHLGVFAAE